LAGCIEHLDSKGGREIDKESLQSLGKHLLKFITFEAGPRVGRLLPQSFKSQGCDHSLTRTTEWLEANASDIIADTRWLKQHGGTCDCKVITNIVWRLDEEAEF
jgi:hypothetical protein